MTGRSACETYTDFYLYSCRFKYYGYSTWVNALDYTSVVVPVTTVDKKVDVKEEAFKALDEQDKSIQDDCKCARKFLSFWSCCCLAWKFVGLSLSRVGSGGIANRKETGVLTRVQMTLRFMTVRMLVCSLLDGDCRRRR